MFKVPDWEADVPKSDIILKRIKTQKQLKNGVTPTSTKKAPSPKDAPAEQHEIKVKKNVNKQAKKRKCNGQLVNNNNNKGNDSEYLDLNAMERNKPKKALKAKKKKMYEPLQRNHAKHTLFKEETKAILERNHVNCEPEEHETQDTIWNMKNRSLELTYSKKINKKKERLKAILNINNNRNSINTNGNKLRERMLERLKAAQFRYLNEKLYTSSGSEAKELFQSDPAAFHTYHQGYQQQLKKWPINPIDVIVKRIQKMPKTHVIADMGCGEAALAKRIPNKVRSFDLVSTAPGVEICDMAHTPLLAESVDVAVYCLALMGTELTQYLVEANRVLKMGGHLLIAEVESRFDDVEMFTKEVMKLGFKLKSLDKTHKVFFFMQFIKIREPPKKSKQPVLTLKPCLYKRR